jgi:hypothetical protein
MERTMREASDVRRVAAVVGATAAAVAILLLGRPVFFATTAQKVPAVQASKPQRAETETVAFVASPVIDPDPQFFFGAGDNSNGYYGSGKPTFVRYARMP